MSGPERYRCADVARFALGPDRELLMARRSGRSNILPSAAAGLLLQCQTFRTLEQHGAGLARSHRLSPAETAVLRRFLRRQESRGLLLAESRLRKALAAGPRKDEPEARISRVCVPTRNRVDGLELCLGSFSRSVRDSGRDAAFLVLDDSELPATRQACQRALARLRRRDGVRIEYAGPEEKRRYIGRLARRSGPPRALLEYALLGPAGVFAAGCNRNAALLDTVGELLLSVDDDTQSLVLRTGAEPGLAFSSGGDPAEFWFLPPGRRAGGEGGLRPADVIGLHEGLLGATLGAAGRRFGAGGLFFDGMDAGRLERLRADGRVRGTFMGVAGDNGMGGPYTLLRLAGDSRRRLVSSAGAYAWAFRSREIVRGVRRPTVGSSTFCMAVAMGLDNRGPMPPFMPLFRNEDGVFGSVFHKCMEGDYLGHVPWALYHRPPSARSFSRAHIRAAARYMRFNDVLRSWIFDCDPGSAESPEDRLRSLGRLLREAASGPERDFQERFREHVWRLKASMISTLEDALREHGGRPAFWAGEARYFIGEMARSMTHDRAFRPIELEAGGPRAFQRTVRLYGELLEAWPGILDAARDARARGVRLGAAL